MSHILAIACLTLLTAIWWIIQRAARDCGASGCRGCGHSHQDDGPSSEQACRHE